MKVTGNTILITGGGSGIGRAFAEAFHKLGNRVIVAGRRKQVLEETIAANPGMELAVIDIEDATATKASADELLKRFPTVNVVIHSAGIMQAEDFVSKGIDVATAEAMIATNLLGPIRLTAALLPNIIKQPEGAILTVSSGLGFTPLALTPTYCATKAAIHSYSQSLRYQLRNTKVEVIEIIPPYVRTGLMGPGQAADTRAMPLEDFISESMNILQTRPRATEVIVERVKPLRFAEQGGPEKYESFFRTFNEAMMAPH